jgi:hypothetical protein
MFFSNGFHLQCPTIKNALKISAQYQEKQTNSSYYIQTFLTEKIDCKLIFFLQLKINFGFEKLFNSFTLAKILDLEGIESF